MYIKFKFTKKSHVCCEKIIHAFLAPANAPKTMPHAPAPLQTPLRPCERPLHPANAPFTKYLDIHSFNSYTFDREQQKF